MRASCRRGGSLLDVLAMLAVAAILLAGAVAMTGRAYQRWRAPAAMRVAESDFRRIRGEAVARRRNEGITFQRDGAGRWTMTFVEDGDGDGILTEDMRRGIDRVRQGPFLVRQRWGVEPGFAGSLRTLRSPPPDPETIRLDDPVKFGARDIVSCSPRGTITPGTVYLTDGTERQLAVVVYGATARVRAWEYLLGPGQWVLR
jgi:hypothetical protein